MNKREIIIEYGRVCKTRNLVEQAAYTCDLAQLDLSDLAEVGLTPALLDECDLLRKEINRLELQQVPAAGDSPLTIYNVHGLVSEAKRWLKKAKLKANRAFRLNGPVLRTFFNYPVAGRSISNCITALIKLIELHRQYDAELYLCGGGAAFADKGAVILKSLQDFKKRQELNNSAISAASAELYYKQGLLYCNIKDIHDMAHEAYIDDPLKARYYSMAILDRRCFRQKVMIEA